MRHRHVTGIFRPKTESLASLLWETLTVAPLEATRNAKATDQSPRRTKRLPFDTRCAAVTKSGRRCRGKIRNETDFCAFHDPNVTEERRRRNAAKGGHTPRRLSVLPDGFLRKLSSRRAVGQAMDRLYREIRLGYMTPEMGRVLFDILTRLLDSGLCEPDAKKRPVSGRARADRLRPKVDDLLTFAERRAWKKAVEKAPAHLFQSGSDSQRSKHQEIGEVALGPRGAGHLGPKAAMAWTAAS